MFGRMFLKEWKERWGLLGLAIFMIGLFVFLYVSPSASENMRLYSTGTLYLIFLPVFALLLGSSGFSAEFKDSAWTYLFSRPVRKETLWLTKLVSLAAMLLFVFFLISLLKLILPGLAVTSRDLFSPIWMKPDIPLQAFAFTISLLAFFISFSMSFLHDRLFVLIFMSVLVIGLLFAFNKNFFLVVMMKLFSKGFTIPTEFKDLWILAGMAFLGASLLTFRKTDFSQPAKKSKRFIVLVIPLLIAAQLLSLGWAMISGSILPQRKGTWAFTTSDKSIYFCTNRGIHRYDAADDSCQRILRHSGLNAITIRSGKMVFTSGYFGELWALNTNGSDKVRLYPPSSSLREIVSEFVFNAVLISPNGEKAVFHTMSSIRRPEDPSSNRQKRLQPEYYLHTLSLDGRDHSFEKKGRLSLLAWPESAGGIFIARTRREKRAYFTRFEVLNTDFDEVSGWEFEGYWPWYRTFVSPRQNFLALTAADMNDKSVPVLLLDLKTGKLPDSSNGDHYALRDISWSSDESAFAFFVRKPAQRSILVWCYDLESGLASQPTSFPYEPGESSPPIGLCFSSDGKTIYYLGRWESENHLVSIDLKSQKISEIPLPGNLHRAPAQIHTVGRKLLVSIIKEKTIWRLDLDTMDWKMIF
ncbi:MAG: ABC transporter permease [Acidobacteria bacterium]|nr:ABC transporter permease [Acidobacteriota bacterium]